jgi:hypothetical protein
MPPEQLVSRRPLGKLHSISLYTTDLSSLYPAYLISETIRVTAGAGRWGFGVCAGGRHLGNPQAISKAKVTLAGRVAWSGLTPFRSGQAQDRGNGENSVPSSPCLQAAA